MTTIRQVAPSLSIPERASRTRRRRERAAAPLAATVATGAVWLAGHVLGVDYLLRDSIGKATISLPVVIVFTLIFGFLGWAALAVLEHYTRRAVTAWTVLATAVTLLSLLPILAEHATGGTKAALAVIHLSVAAVLIPLLRRSASPTAGGGERS